MSRKRHTIAPPVFNVSPEPPYNPHAVVNLMNLLEQAPRPRNPAERNAAATRNPAARNPATRNPAAQGPAARWALVDGRIVPAAPIEAPIPPADPLEGAVEPPPDSERKAVRLEVLPPLDSLPSFTWTRVSVPRTSGAMVLDEAFATKFTRQLNLYYRHRIGTLKKWLDENPGPEAELARARCQGLIMVMSDSLKVMSPGVTLDRLQTALNDPEHGLYSIVGREKVKERMLATLKAFSVSWKSFEGFSNILLLGGPGTGKTSLARVVAWVYGSAGLIETTSYRVVTPSDLVAKYVGHSGPQTREAYLGVMGGVLMIDEAYQLRGRGPGNNFGDEAITELVNLMDKLPYVVVVAAGYASRMKEEFLSANEGLKRRFPTTIELTPFSGMELAEVCIRDLVRRTPLAATDLAVIRDLVASAGPDFFSGQAGDMLNLAKAIASELMSREIPHEEMTASQRASVIADAFESLLG